MLTANLLPDSRRAALLREDRMAAWTRLTLAYCALIAFAWLCVGPALGGDGAGPQKSSAGILAERDRLEASIKALESKIARTKSLMIAARAVGGHPDWSRLLNLLSSLRGEEIQVERVRLARCEVGGQPKPGAAAGRAYRLRINGVAPDHGAIVHFALRLEATRLFEKVDLNDNRKDGASVAGALSFEIEAILDDSAGGEK